MNKIIKCIFYFARYFASLIEVVGMMPFPTLPSFDGIRLTGATPRSSGFQQTPWIASGDLIFLRLPIFVAP